MPTQAGAVPTLSPETISVKRLPKSQVPPCLRTISFTVAVSIAAGVAQITSAYPELFPYRVWMSVIAVFLIMLINLRGVKNRAWRSPSQPTFSS